jgi:tetratricopeptide (TPR) repeat protein
MLKPDQMQAAKSLLQIIGSNPLDIPTYCKLAGLYESAGEGQKAHLTLRRALEIDPLHPEAWIRLGIHHMNLGEWRNAADAFERSTVISPTDASGWMGGGMASIASQNLRTACKMRDTLMMKFADRAETHLIAGHVSKIGGHFGAAADSYQRALALNPGQVEALYNLVDLTSPALTDPLTERLESLLRSPSLSDRESAMARFSLASIYERAGSVDQAFALYRSANAAAAAMMQGSGNAYDARRTGHEVERTVEVFSRAALADPLEPLDIGIRLIFIVGMPRSGTTLTERILSNHSQVSAGGELPFMQECLAKLRSELGSTKVWGGARSDSSHRGFLLRLRNEYLDALFESELDGDYVTDKLPANFSALGLIRILFPDALIVHCTRDAIATCWSLYTSYLDSHLSYHTSFDDLIHYHNKVYGRYIHHWDSIPEINIIHMAYEGLIADPATRIRELLRRCGLPWEAACLNVQDNVQPIFTASVAQARQPIYSTSLTRWRKFAQHLQPLVDGLVNPRTARGDLPTVPAE